MDDERPRIKPVEEVQLLRAASCDWRLSRGTLGVFAVILKHCDADRRAFPGPTRIAKEARLAVTNVKGCIAQLERLRYISVDRPGLRKANRFQVLHSPNCLPRHARMPRFTRKCAADERPSGHTDIPSSTPDWKRPTGHTRMQPTRHAGMTQLGIRARHEVAFKALPKSQKLVDDSDDQEPERSPEREQAMTEMARRMYLKAKEDGNLVIVGMIEANHRERIADLIEKAA